MLLTDNEIAQGKRDEFINRFKRLYQANEPDACALFESAAEGEGWRAYFSSTDRDYFSALERAYLCCVPSNKPHPDRDSLSWLAGDESWERVFSDP